MRISLLLTLNLLIAKTVHIGVTGSIPSPRDSLFINIPGAHFVFEPLLKRDIYGQFQCLLCESYHVYDDRIEINLNPHVYFSNQKPLTVSSVQNSLKPLTVKKLSDVSFSIPSPSPQKTLSLLSKIPITDALKGTGPYVIDDLSPRQVTYQSNPNDWQKRNPAVQTIIYHAYPSTFELHLAFLAKDIDVYIENSAARFDKMIKEMPENVLIYPHPDHHYMPHLWLNPKRLFQDPILRKVLHRSIMCDRLNETLFYHQYTTSSPPLSVYQRQLESLTQLEKANWNLNSQFIREKNHQTAIMNILVFNHRWDSLLLHLQQQLYQLGLKLNIEYVSYLDYLERLQTQDFDMVIAPIIDQSYHTPTYNKQLLPCYNTLPMIQALIKQMPQPLLDTTLEKLILKQLKQQNYIIEIFKMDHYRIVKQSNISIPNQQTDPLDPNQWAFNA